jgi:hypothetical protein
MGDSRLSSPLFMKTGLSVMGNKDIPYTTNNVEKGRKLIN